MKLLFIGICLLSCVFVTYADSHRHDRGRFSHGHHYRHHSIDGSDGVDSVCPVRRYPCRKNCGSAGYRHDENGCELCACNVPDSADCPALECPTISGVCPFGRARDENGCIMCECRPDRRNCTVVPRCQNYCPNGFDIGTDGCPTCQCHVPGSEDSSIQTAPMSLSVVAASSSSTGDQPTEKLCAMCLKYCPTGFQMGPDGCPLCACNDEPPVDVTTPAVPGRRPVGGGRGGPRRPGAGAGRRGGRRGGGRRTGTIDCLRPACPMYCPHGMRRDENGCTLCECQQPGEAPIPVPSDPSIQCPRLRCHRRRKCAHGFVVDSSSGCASCACRSLPVDDSAATS